MAMDSQLQDSANTASTSNPTEHPQCRQPGRWGMIVKPNGGPHDVRMVDDTGTPVNWIHPDLIERCKLDREICKTEMFKDFHGKSFKVKEYVWFTWVGREDDKSYSGDFYPAPGTSEVDVVLGNDFVKKYGRAEDVCAPEPRLRDARVFAQNSMSKQEKKEIEANQANHNRQAAELSKRNSGTPRKTSGNQKNDKKHGSSSHKRGNM